MKAPGVNVEIGDAGDQPVLDASGSMGYPSLTAGIEQKLNTRRGRKPTGAGEPGGKRLMRHALKVRAQSCGDFRRLRLSRRQTLQAGALAFTGLSWPALLRAKQVVPKSGADGFGRAKSCILIFLWGGPSQLDTWDPKPGAPEDIRGPFRAIGTTVPAISISEHFPLLAQQVHRLTIVRSMSHDDAAHLSTAHRLLTGHLAPTPNSDAAGPSARDWPHLGALVAKLRPSTGAIPSAVNMPWTVMHPAAPGGRAPGQDAGWLGKAYDPFHIEGDPSRAGFHVEGLGLPEGIAQGRLASRRALAKELAGAAGRPCFGPQSWDAYQQKALDGLISAEARGAFQIGREDPRLRDRYGRHIHGHCLLLARRLVEAGVGLVTVNWHNDGQFFWDTHGNNFNQLKHRLMPPADQGFSALIEDLDIRGLLDETLVVWVGEFGRTPRINKANSGREHWPQCYSAVVAGAGIRGGFVFGASDRWAAYPARDPVSPEDLGATILHALGIDPGTLVKDALDRPLRINDGSPILRLFA
jgi:hypothetical protein